MKESILSQISALNQEDKSRLYKVIEGFLFDNEVDISSEQSKAKVAIANNCPHCASTKTRKNGYQYGVQRFVCNTCKKNFRVSTGSVTAHLKKRALLKVYIPNMLAGYSLEKCAKLTGISKQTSFDWRHKILSALGKFQKDQMLSGICESDDVFIAFSEKGNRHLEREARKRGKSVFIKKKRGINDDKVAILISCDRKGNKHLQVATRGRVSAEDINNVLKDKLEPKTVLCTDSHRSFEAFAKENNIEHQTIKVSAKEYVKKGIYHVQHVNQTAQDLKKWLETFNGVSTKYLQNYLNWYALETIINENQSPVKKTIKLIATSFTAWYEFKDIINLTYIN
jgi:transposase-like protein